MNKQNYEKALEMISSAVELFKKALDDKKPMSIDDHRQVTIGKQTWLAENLKIDDGGEGIYFNEENSEYYYTWYATMRVAKTIPGWHLPTIDEWNELAKATGDFDNAGKYLKSTTGWYNDNGTDAFGFASFPTNFLCSGFHGRLSSNALFWTATESTSSNAFTRYFSADTSMGWFNNNKTKYACSVRLVKDS